MEVAGRLPLPPVRRQPPLCPEVPEALPALPLTTWFPAFHLIAQRRSRVTGKSPRFDQAEPGQGLPADRGGSLGQAAFAPRLHRGLGRACFAAVKAAGCRHVGIVVGGGPQSLTRKEFVWVNTLLGNVKKAIHGVFHAIGHKHQPRYLAEPCYRFNWRFRLDDMPPRRVYVAARTPPMPGRPLKLAEAYGYSEIFIFVGGHL